jgi:c-di-GMP-binding flagellar brake protein YcgR
MAWEGQERRQFPRAVFPCKIVVSSPIRLITSHTENISEGGIRVMLEERLAPHSPVGIELFFEKAKPIKCKGKIAWVRERLNPLEREATMYDTGVRFVDISDKDREYIKTLVGALIEQGKEDK